MKCKIINEDDIKQIISLYQNGISCVKLGEMYNVSGNTISSLLKRNNINVVNKQNLITFKDEDIIKDYCDLKLSLSQIAKK